ncbi:M20/M25/M40 family metallo-hydrolase [Candidatus Dojkabacteria bacterium]|nr:M20/M25/M40 family metallo-hydrolase [Candidatus Dojkabacteria bacterium]
MNIEKYKELLKEYVSFQSISTDPDKKEGVLQTAEWLRKLFEEYKFQTQFLTYGTLNPVVFAEYKAEGATKTVLVYGHYDVQPAEKEAGWNSEPFELTEDNGRLYARGIVDNKGENLIHIFSVLELIKANKLKYNVKFLIEGNEETGNIDDIGTLMEENVDLLRSDYVLVSDGELVGGQVAIESSYRGGCSITIRYKVANNNTHSGLYGGAVPNAAYELSKLLAKVYDENNVVTFPDFYKGVLEATPEELENNRRLAEIGQKDALAHPGYKALRTENNQYDFYTQTGLRPTMQVTGLKSGYIGNGYSNIVPAIAEAKINLRTAPMQDTDEVVKAITEFVDANTPDYVEYEMEVSGKHPPVKLDTGAEIFREVRELLKESYGTEVFTYNVGGAIPLIAKVKELFGIDTVSVGLANEDCNMHGANENFRLDLLEKGLKFSERFFSK